MATHNDENPPTQTWKIGNPVAPPFNDEDTTSPIELQFTNISPFTFDEHSTMALLTRATRVRILQVFLHPATGDFSPPNMTQAALANIGEAMTKMENLEMFTLFVQVSEGHNIDLRPLLFGLREKKKLKHLVSRNVRDLTKEETEELASALQTLSNPLQVSVLKGVCNGFFSSLKHIPHLELLLCEDLSRMHATREGFLEFKDTCSRLEFLRVYVDASNKVLCTQLGEIIHSNQSIKGMRLEFNCTDPKKTHFEQIARSLTGNVAVVRLELHMNMQEGVVDFNQAAWMQMMISNLFIVSVEVTQDEVNQDGVGPNSDFRDFRQRMESFATMNREGRRKLLQHETRDECLLALIKWRHDLDASFFMLTHKPQLCDSGRARSMSLSGVNSGAKADKSAIL